MKKTIWAAERQVEVEVVLVQRRGDAQLVLFARDGEGIFKGLFHSKTRLYQLCGVG